MGTYMLKCSRMVLKAVGIVGIVLGFSGFFLGGVVFLEGVGTDIVMLCGSAIFAVMLWIIGAYLVYISYLTVKRTELMAVRPICFLMALGLYFWIDPIMKSNGIALEEKGLKSIGAMFDIVSLPLAALAYFACTWGLERLCKEGNSEKTEKPVEKL